MKTFKFIFDDVEYTESSSWPVRSNITAFHEFNDETSWPVVLYQFAKFLESSGYVGVTSKIQIEDKYGIHDTCGFTTYNDEDNDELDEEIIEALDNIDKDAQ